MSDLSNRIVQKLWSYCNVLRDDGLSYQDYLEQLTYILFLKMADERATVTGEAQAIPKGTAGPTSPTLRSRACGSRSTIARRFASSGRRAECSA